MTTIEPTALNVHGSSIRVSNNNRPGENQTYIEVSRGRIAADLHGGKGYTALDQNEAFSLIKAVATTSGLLFGESGGALGVRVPKPKKTPQQIAEEKRRAELNNMHHSDLLDLVLSLEKEGGRL